MSLKDTVQGLLERGGTGVVLNGTNPWDPQIRDERVFKRVLGGGTLALGESYMDGWWDATDLAELFSRLIAADFRKHVSFTIPTLVHLIQAKLFNRQGMSRAFEVGQKHYDIGNDLYRAMLGTRMVYTCGYWKDAHTLDEAQDAKLDLVCSKIGLKSGDRVLDIGGGWGSFAKFAAEKYGATVVAVTVSKAQVELGQKLCVGLPVEMRLQDYREIADGPYDHIVSLGMFEHVGVKNYLTFMKLVRSLLKEDGLFLLHTIGGSYSGAQIDPWLDKYIFPNAAIPTLPQITRSAEGQFVIEDLHNFGTDYDKTLHMWLKNVDAHWQELPEEYDERFYRMWKYYLMISAGFFRARKTQLWQIVLSPRGVQGGYTSIR